MTDRGLACGLRLLRPPQVPCRVSLTLSLSSIPPLTSTADKIRSAIHQNRWRRFWFRMVLGVEQSVSWHAMIHCRPSMFFNAKEHISCSKPSPWDENNLWGVNGSVSFSIPKHQNPRSAFTVRARVWLPSITKHPRPVGKWEQLVLGKPTHLLYKLSMHITTGQPLTPVCLQIGTLQFRVPTFPSFSLLCVASRGLSLTTDFDVSRKLE